MENENFKIEWIEISKINPAPYNPRKDLTPDDLEYQKIKKSLNEFGLVDPLIINEDLTLIGGHQRLKVLAEAGFTSVPCSIVPLDKKKEKALNIALNKITGDWDLPKLSELLVELDDGAFDMESIGFSADELESLLVDKPGGGLTDDDAVPETPEEPTTKLGDLYILGDHRLLCGDATKKEDAKRLMDGEKADMVFTDPPYGVNYTGKTKDALKIKSDNVDEPTLKSLVDQWFSIAFEVSRGGAYWLATVPARPLHGIFLADWKSRGILRQVMVWVKDSMVLGHSEYHYKHEPILFGWVPGGERLKCSDRTKTTVWEFDRPKVSREHPTMKPVEMWEYGIKNHSSRENLLYEPFGGSGTTLIACEKTNRKCRMMEIDPVYCDVIVKRWEEYTGKTAELVNG